MSIYLVIYLSIQSYLYHHHLSFNHLEMFRLVLFINMYLYDMIIYPIFIYQCIYPSILYLSVSVFPFIHLLNNNQHLSSDHFEMHRICILFVCLTSRKNMSIYPTIHLSFNLFKQIHLPTCLSI